MIRSSSFSTSYNASYAYGALLTTDALFAMCFPTPKIPVAVCQNGFMDYSKTCVSATDRAAIVIPGAVASSKNVGAREFGERTCPLPIA